MKNNFLWIIYMSLYNDLYYEPNYLEQALSNMGGGALSDNSIYLLIGLLLVVIIYIVYEMNSKYNSLVTTIRDPRQLQIVASHPQSYQASPPEEIPQEDLQIPQEEVQTQQQQPGVVNVNVHKLKKEVPFFPERTPFDLWREYDYRSLNDPLVAPRRRDDFNLPVLPFPSRGYPAPYKKVGLLIDKGAHDNDRYKILLLMGRNTHPGSYVFEYYAVENDKNSALKFDVCKHGKYELQTDDKIRISELDRTYTVVMDKILGYEYDPYIY
jgi:Family of unknown function (DUF5755)